MMRWPKQKRILGLERKSEWEHSDARPQPGKPFIAGRLGDWGNFPCSGGATEGAPG